jgi:hypothetical protein
MNKYNKSIIYKIEHVSNPELCYIGGTTNFNARKAQHKSRTLNPNDKEHNGYKYKMIRDNGGWDMFRMVALKSVNVNSKRELEMEEEQFRQLYKANMNAHKSFLNDNPIRPSPEAKFNAELNQAIKLEKYRKEHAEEIQKYRNDKAFLNVIKKKKYTIDDYKEPEVRILTFSDLKNEIVDGHNGFNPNMVTSITTEHFKDLKISDDLHVELCNDVEVKDCSPIRKRGRPKKIIV